jgi:hypothetical protein
MNTNILKEPVASIFRVEYHATQEKIACGRGKQSGTGAAGIPMGRCIIISALELSYSPTAWEILSSNVCMVCSLQTGYHTFIHRYEKEMD